MPVLLLFVRQVLQVGGVSFGFKGAVADFQFVTLELKVGVPLVDFVWRGLPLRFYGFIFSGWSYRPGHDPTYFGASGDGSFPADSSTCRAR